MKTNEVREQVNEAEKAYARGASAVGKNELSEDYIIPSVFDRDVVPRVAKAVAAAARATGVARRRIRIDDDLR